MAFEADKPVFFSHENPELVRFVLEIGRPVPPDGAGDHNCNDL